jgi:FtsH-binding integral membrane protein
MPCHLRSTCTQQEEQDRNYLREIGEQRFLENPLELLSLFDSPLLTSLSCYLISCLPIPTKLELSKSHLSLLDVSFGVLLSLRCFFPVRLSTLSFPLLLADLLPLMFLWSILVSPIPGTHARGNPVNKLAFYEIYEDSTGLPPQKMHLLWRAKTILPACSTNKPDMHGH